MYKGMLADMVTTTGANGDAVPAYFARPVASGPLPSVVLIMHLPGWDELYMEFTRRFAHRGYMAICPNLYHREASGTPEDVAAKVRAAGGVADAQVVGDIEGALKYVKGLADSNGKAAVFGTCSGGRHAFLVGCKSKNVDAVVECWGGRVVMAQADLNPKTPESPVTLTAGLSAPLLGLFGNDDQSPTPAQVDQHEAELKKHGKNYEFHRYDGAGHGFFYYDRPAYRPQQAVEGWNKIWGFLPKHIGQPAAPTWG
jgi:carboxymethylenebutenolidase